MADYIGREALRLKLQNMENGRRTAMEAKCSLNYEAEYERIRDEYNCLKEKLFHMEEKAKCLWDENQRYKTILKTLEFMLGRKFDAADS